MAVSVGSKNIPVGDFEIDVELGNDFCLYVSIKNFERHLVRESVVARRAGRNPSLSISPPKQGAILRLPLKDANLRESSVDQHAIVFGDSPYVYRVFGDIHVYATFSEARFLSGGVHRVFSHTLCKRLHFVDYLRSKYLLASAGFDVIFLLNEDLSIDNIFRVWEHLPSRYFRDGQRMELIGSDDYAGQSDDKNLVDPSSAKWKNGLGIAQSPFYLNGATFGENENEVLFTGYNSGSIFFTNFEETNEHKLGLRSPHSLRTLPSWWDESYLVLNSGDGCLLLLNEKIRITDCYDFSGIPKDTGKYGAEEWLQSATILGSEVKIVAVVDLIRCCIHLLDLRRNTRRQVDFPSQWSVHSAEQA